MVNESLIMERLELCCEINQLNEGHIIDQFKKVSNFGDNTIIKYAKNKAKKLYTTKNLLRKILINEGLNVDDIEKQTKQLVRKNIKDTDDLKDSKEIKSIYSHIFKEAFKLSNFEKLKPKYDEESDLFKRILLSIGLVVIIIIINEKSEIIISKVIGEKIGRLQKYLLVELFTGIIIAPLIEEASKSIAVKKGFGRTFLHFFHG
ncbi:MAG: hypothetical protein ACOCQD_00965 [archaeon]